MSQYVGLVIDEEASNQAVSARWFDVDALSPRIPDYLALALPAAWAFWFGRLAVRSWNGFWFGTFDLGIFDQGTWLLSRGIDPFITLRGLHLFGDHSSYILLLVAPFYWVWPDINLLVVLAVVVPAVGAWLTYRIGLAEGLGPWSALAISAVVLLHPAMAWTTWDSFHPETFAIALIPAAYVAARRDRRWLFVFLSLLLALVKEDAFLVLIPLATYVGWQWKKLRIEAVGVILISAGVAVLNFAVVLPGYSPTDELIYSGRYSADVASLLTSGRAGYLAAMFLPILIALRAPFVLAIAGPITVANLASQFPYQHEIRWHYTAYLLGVLAVAAPVGMAKLTQRWGTDVEAGLVSATRRMSVPLALPLVAAAIVGLLMVGPDLTYRGGSWGGASASRQAEVYAAFSMIPDDAVVAASHTFAPQLAHRSQIYMLPNPWIADAWGVSDDVPPRPDPSTIEWVAVNTVSAGETELGVIEEIEGNGWEEVASGDGFRLLRASP